MDDGDVFIEAEGGVFTSLSETPYASEDELQSLLERNAGLLGGRQMDMADPVRFVLVKREPGVPADQHGGDRWSIDHVFLDQRAVPTIVEVKRSSDTRIRREVVGQMLDYAANAVAYWPSTRLRTDFEETCAARGEDPVTLIAALIDRDGDTAPDRVAAEVEDYWERVSANLQAGRLRLLFVADAIPAELRRIVEFLNERMTQTDVLAIEVRNYTGDGVRVVAPRVLGATSASERTKGSAPGPKKDVAILLEEAPVVVREACDLLDAWAADVGLVAWNYGQGRRYAWEEGDAPLVYLYPGRRSVELDFTRITDDVGKGLRRGLSDLFGKGITDQYPSVPCADLVTSWHRLRADVLGPYLEAARRS